MHPLSRFTGIKAPNIGAARILEQSRSQSRRWDLEPGGFVMFRYEIDKCSGLPDCGLRWLGGASSCQPCRDDEGKQI